MRKGSLRRRLALLFFASALPGLLAIGIVGLHNMRKAIAASEAELLDFSDHLAETQHRTTESTRQMLESLAAMPEVRNADAPACTRIFAQALKANPIYGALHLVDVHGRTIASGRPGPAADFSDRKHFKDAVRLKSFATGEYILGVTLRVPVFAFGHPVLDASGRVRAVLLTSILLSSFEQLFQQTRFPPKSFLGIADQNGLRLYRCPPDPSTPLGKPIRSAMFEAAKRAKPNGMAYDRGADGVERLVAYTQLRLNADSEPYMYLFVGIPKAQLYTKVQQGLARDLGLLLLAIGLTLGAVWHLSGRTAGRRLAELAEAAEKLGAGDLSVRARPCPEIREVDVLAKAFNGMADALSSEINEIREARAQLQSHTERFQRISQLSTDITFSCMEERGVFRLDWLAGAVERITGHSGADLMAAGCWRHLVHPDDLPIFDAKVAGLAAGQKSRCALRIRNKDGRVVWLDAVTEAVAVPEDPFHSRLFGGLSDITAARHAAEALREQEATYRSLFLNIMNSVVHARVIFEAGQPVDMEYISTNPAFATVSGIALPVEGKRISEVIPGYCENNRESLDVFARVALTGAPTRYEHYLAELGRWFAFFIYSPAQGEVIIVAENITERKLAEEALRDSEQRFRTLTQVSPVGIFQAEAGGRCTFVNDQWSVISGMPKSAALGRGWLRTLRPKDRSRALEGFRESLRTGRDFIAEFRFREDVASGAWLLLHAAAEYAADGTFIGFVGAITDITELKRAGEALRTSERRFRRLFQEAPLPLCYVNKDGRLLDINRRFTQSFGYTLKDVPTLAQWWPRAYPDPNYRGEVLATWSAAMERAAKTGSDIEPQEYRLTCRDGGERIVVISGIAIGQDFLATFFDVTERKQAEQKLVKSERQLSIAMNMAKLGHWEFDVARRMFTFSDSFYAIFHTTARAMRGYEMPAAEYALRFLPPDERHRVADEAALAIAAQSEDYSRYLEHRFLYADGGVGHMAVHISIMKDAQGRTVKTYGVNQDITERKQFIEALLEAKEAAEAASRAKSEFLANMSHEVRTPLNGMLGMLQVLKQTDEPKERLRYTVLALEAGRRLLSLLNDILDFSKMEAGHLQLTQRPFSLRRLFADVEGVFSVSSRERGLELSFEADASVPELLIGDEARLRQILFNLVGNALKFSHQGGIRVEAWARPTLLPAGGLRLYVSVADTGIGIPDDKLAVIFERFTQTDSSYSRRFEGAGLGLAIVKRIVQRMGGGIVVDSEEGVGTTIVLHLPVALAESETGAPASEPAGEPAAPRPLRILLAEDEPISQLSMRTLLMRMGHEVTLTTNGREALEAMRAQEFDCVLMDVQMPEMNGLEATRAIRELCAARSSPRIPVIALTAYAMQGDREEFLNAGMDDCVTKPVQMEELVRALARAAGKGGQEA